MFLITTDILHVTYNTLIIVWQFFEGIMLKTLTAQHPDSEELVAIRK